MFMMLILRKVIVETSTPDSCLRKGREFAENFMNENVVLVPVVDDDLQVGMPKFLTFMEKMRGVAGTSCHVCKDSF